MDMPVRKALGWLGGFPWKRASQWAGAGAIVVTVIVQLGLADRSGRPAPPGPEPAPTGPALTPPSSGLTPPGPSLAPPSPSIRAPGPSLIPPGPSLAPPNPSLAPPAPSSPTGRSASSGLAPAFSERGVLDGQPLTSARLRGKDVLLFFGRSVGCRICKEQIQALQLLQAELRPKGMTLVDVTADDAPALRRALVRLRIATPTISDPDGGMSSAYGPAGQSTSGDGAGHSFVLLDRAGRVRWSQDYPMIYVPPGQLLVAISRNG